MKSLARWGLGNTSVPSILTLSLSSPVSFDNPFLLSISDYVLYCSIQGNNSFLVSCSATILFLKHNCTFCLWNGPFSSPSISSTKTNMLPKSPFFFKINTTYFFACYQNSNWLTCWKWSPICSLKEINLGNRHSAFPHFIFNASLLFLF